MIPRRIAHRGVSARHPENSWAAFQAALDEGSWEGIETDVQQAADGSLLLIHDELNTENPPAADAPELNAFLTRYGGRLELLLEAKLYPSQSLKLIDGIADAILAHDLADSTWLLCFDETALRHCHQRTPAVRTVLNTLSLPARDRETTHLSALSICIDALEDRAPDTALPWMCWTCNRPEQRQQATRLGADWLMWDG